MGKGIIPLLDEKTRHDSAPDRAAGSHMRPMGAADLISAEPDRADSDPTQSGAAKSGAAKFDTAKFDTAKFDTAKFDTAKFIEFPAAIRAHHHTPG